MNRFSLIAGVALVASLVSMQALASAPSTAELSGFVDGVVADAMKSDHIGGVQVAVVLGGETVLQQGYGIADVNPSRPVDPQGTLFRVASISKTFTWILLMRLVEAGRVQLDAPINSYLPASLQVPDEGYSKPIRVVDLMSHSPGFEDLSLGRYLERGAIAETPLIELLAKHRPRRVREPGLFSTYSNYGVVLAGMIVEHVTGQDIQTVAEREIFQPLGMEHTTFREPYAPRANLPAPMSQELAADRAAPLLWRSGHFEADDYEFITAIAASGGVSSTAADMARYMKLLLRDGTLDGQQIFGPVAAKAFRTPIIEAPEGINGWAHGFRVQRLPGGFVGYNHRGATLYFMSSLTVIPELDLGIFVTTNTASGDPLARDLAGNVLERFYAQPVPQRAASSSLGQDAARYTGRYIGTRRAYTGLEKFATLWSPQSTVSVRGGYLHVDGGALQDWVPDGAPGRFRAALGDDVLVFNMDDSGRAASFSRADGSARFERAGFFLDSRILTIVAGLSLFTALLAMPMDIQRLRRGSSSMLVAGGALSAGLWILVAVLAAIWFSQRDDIAELYLFPGALLLAVSITALVASAATFALVVSAVRSLALKATMRCAVMHLIAAAPWVLLIIHLACWGLLSPWA